MAALLTEERNQLAKRAVTATTVIAKLMGPAAVLAKAGLTVVTVVMAVTVAMASEASLLKPELQMLVQ